MVKHHHHHTRVPSKDANRSSQRFAAILTSQRIVAVLMLLVSIGIIVGVSFTDSARYRRPVIFSAIDTTLFTVEVIWLVLAAVLISFVVHVYLCFAKYPRRRYTNAVLDTENLNHLHRMARHINTYRWMLYNLFWGLLLVALAMIAGASDMLLLVSIGIVTVFLQRFALNLEEDNHMAQSKRDVNLWELCYGGVAWAYIVTVTLGHFVFVGLGAGYAIPSAIIYVAVLGGHMVLICVGIATCLRYTAFSSFWKCDYNIELVYLVLEVAAALVVSATLIVGAFTF